MWLLLSTYSASFPQVKSLGKLAGKIISRSGKSPNPTFVHSPASFFLPLLVWAHHCPPSLGIFVLAQTYAPSSALAPWSSCAGTQAHIHQHSPTLSLPVLACTLCPIFRSTLSFCHTVAPINWYMARAIHGAFVAPLMLYENKIDEVSFKLGFILDELIFIGLGEEQYRRNFTLLSFRMFFFYFWLNI